MTGELNNSSRSTLQIQSGCRYTVTSEPCPSGSLRSLCSKPSVELFKLLRSWISILRSLKVGKDSSVSICFATQSAYLPASFVYLGELSRSTLSWDSWNSSISTDKLHGSFLPGSDLMYSVAAQPRNTAVSPYMDTIMHLLLLSDSHYYLMYVKASGSFAWRGL